jgi:prevent-host-death family protein
MRVGVREFKAHLSEYLDRAAKGETIEVTRRGIPRVQLRPMPVSARVELGVREGWLTLGDGSEPAVDRPTFHSRVSLQEILDEDRGE